MENPTANGPISAAHSQEAMSEEPHAEKTRSRLAKFFSNPAVGITGSIASVLGVVLATYFYVESTHRRSLTYFVHPVKSIVVRGGESSRLSVTLADREIRGDVTTAQVAFWNTGGEPIRREHVLRPFVIYTEADVPILEARIRKQSRDVIGLNLDLSAIKEGRLGISWQILEQGDGGVVQLMLAGGIETKIAASAVIEGQRRVEALEFTGTIRSPMEQYAWVARQNRRQGYTFLGMGTLMAVFWIGGLAIRRRRRSEIRIRRVDLAFLAQALIVVGFAVYFLLWVRYPGPPFGF